MSVHALPVFSHVHQQLCTWSARLCPMCSSLQSTSATTDGQKCTVSAHTFASFSHFSTRFVSCRTFAFFSSGWSGRRKSPRMLNSHHKQSTYTLVFSKTHTPYAQSSRHLVCQVSPDVALKELCAGGCGQQLDYLNISRVGFTGAESLGRILLQQLKTGRRSMCHVRVTFNDLVVIIKFLQDNKHTNNRLLSLSNR